MDIFEKIILDNKYVQKCVSNKKKDIHSLSYLITYNLSQSDCIKIGIGLENVLRDLILCLAHELIDIKPKNKKGNKEKDHLFVNNNNKNIYYAELKSNLNLDTEKTKSTYIKCLEIKKDLQKEYNNMNIIMFLVSTRHYTTNIIPQSIISKYEPIKDNLIGINEYFKLLSVPIKFDNEKEYIYILNLLAKSMFKL
jgi:hypothetical protein